MAQAIPGKQKWWSGGKSPYNMEYGKVHDVVFSAE